MTEHLIALNESEILETQLAQSAPSRNVFLRSQAPFQIAANIMLCVLITEFSGLHWDAIKSLMSHLLVSLCSTTLKSNGSCL